jgi:pilus assembly protein CpaE
MFNTQPYLDPADRTLRIEVVGRDRTLEEELRAALVDVPDVRAVLYFAPSYRHALEVARDRQPNLIIVDIDREAHEVAGLSKELLDKVPGTVIAGAFRPDRLEQEQSEGSTIIELIRAQVRDFLRRPISTTELREVVTRLFSPAGGRASSATGRLVSFVSNKGGSGKSTLAVNVSCALARRHPDDVLLVDASLQLGTCALMLDLKPATTIVDAVRERDRLDGTLLRRLTVGHSSGLRLLAAPADAIEAADVDDEALARILNMARRTFGFVVVDTFPMLDSIVLTILDLSDVAFVVVQGTAPSVAGAARLLPILNGIGFPESRQRIVLNYNYRGFLGNLRPADIGQRLDRSPDYVVPFDKRVVVSMNTGSPHILHAARWQGFRRTVNALVDDLDGFAIGGHNGQPSLSLSDGGLRRMGVDRRHGADRRLRDLGRAEGDRRSGVDRRAADVERPTRAGMTL